MIFTIIICALFLGLCAALKAAADTMADHYSVSIFRKKDPKFWNKTVSAANAKFIPGTKYRLDGWHLANSGWILFFLLFGFIHPQVLKETFLVTLLYVIGCLAAWGAYFIMVFNFFYNKVLIAKK